MAKDILLDDNYDLLVQNGDFVIGDSEEQEIALILMSNQGEWKMSPLTGFGWVNRLKGEVRKEELNKDLKTQLELDGFINVEVKFDENGALKTVKAGR